jgi:hypothetical protein
MSFSIEEVPHRRSTLKRSLNIDALLRKAELRFALRTASNDAAGKEERK